MGCWGEGGTFLNVVDPAGAVISHVVDVNPRKTGRFIGGLRKKLSSPVT
jgi:hypothetical protein